MKNNKKLLVFLLVVASSLSLYLFNKKEEIVLLLEDINPMVKNTSIKSKNSLKENIVNDEKQENHELVNEKEEISVDEMQMQVENETIYPSHKAMNNATFIAKNKGKTQNTLEVLAIKESPQSSNKPYAATFSLNDIVFTRLIDSRSYLLLKDKQNFTMVINQNNERYIFKDGTMKISVTLDFLTGEFSVSSR